MTVLKQICCMSLPQNPLHQLPVRRGKMNPQQLGDERRYIGHTELLDLASLPDTGPGRDKPCIHIRYIRVIPMMPPLDRGEEPELVILLDNGPGTRIHGRRRGPPPPHQKTHDSTRRHQGVDTRPRPFPGPPFLTTEDVSFSLLP